MIERNIDNAIVSFVNCCKVFSGLLDERQEDQAEKLVGNATMHNGLDLFDEIDEKQGCKDERKDQCNNSVGIFSSDMTSWSAVLGVSAPHLRFCAGVPHSSRILLAI